ncbi:hypothetical protein JET76_22205 [Pseudomonas putida]|uniref:hypothetical protein n=1 Tax=Pseudomonas putida TaxID=303 RepID=UPI0018E69D2E|nr:hypothetical protein [Pseudomonas putida]MBI6944047.1 hypothetical protein [Pseudomonas putida]MBI6960127.1 hypothetical protein [Pseudomonas putida]
MTIDKPKLKALAEATREHLPGVADPQMIVNTSVVLALIAENEALRKDAERYRAIRDEIPHADLGRAILDVQTADEYDAAVDAAMAKEASHD